MSIFTSQNYNTIDKILNMTWEDLEDIGVRKLGNLQLIMFCNDIYFAFSPAQCIYLTSLVSNEKTPGFEPKFIIQYMLDITQNKT